MATPRKAPRTTLPARADNTCVFVRNESVRTGVPLTPAFTRWVATTLRLAGRRKRAEVNIAIVGTEAGRAYNRQFRQRDYATNVLSFPYEPMRHEKTALLGDLVICAPVLAHEAGDQGKRLRDHYAHMTVHGVLHLIGFDHLDDADAQRMEKLERTVLAEFGVRDPYRDHGETTA